ncbi:hypothetical protein FTV88_1949 [Heliorestis convoluta]|uniref:Uncharacterized protein n=1 Tax=Heliorestis convoluta TaxID=356322 RepID=A0A5Q2MZD9_9FIRM|nr:hypothetical protein FTV88_1949 [Heliorestis convoluta]
MAYRKIEIRKISLSVSIQIPLIYDDLQKKPMERDHSTYGLVKKTNSPSIVT